MSHTHALEPDDPNALAAHIEELAGRLRTPFRLAPDEPLLIAPTKGGGWAASVLPEATVVKLREVLGATPLVLVAGGESAAEFDGLARTWGDQYLTELAQTVGGGQVGEGPTAHVESAVRAMAAELTHDALSRDALARGETGEACRLARESCGFAERAKDCRLAALAAVEREVAGGSSELAEKGGE
jgi:hypothetical protein